ncbi:hypothetical protein WICPIJ_008965 [Wickerhamomyces pijperi]|uniref:Protein phosphatase methylesterase 1 n=1 Tax=Wickerhamomyces pijperi TaxID=599730 RepID=A0A9P8PSK1_WICPI|nr:hypothetical protein WICPIJ_008965 [Wickerhamomyces pijperi]
MSSFQRNLFQKKLREAEASLGLNFNEDEEAPPPTASPHTITTNCASPTPPIFSNPTSSSLRTAKPTNQTLPTWDQFFSHNDNVTYQEKGLQFQTYYEPPSSSTSPVFICHHGAGSSGLTFAMFTKQIRHIMEEQSQDNQDCIAGVYSFDARGHGLSTSIDKDHDPVTDFGIDYFIDDFCYLTRRFIQEHCKPTNPVYLLGHSLGGSVVTKASFSLKDLVQIKGVIMIDIVEETAVRSLSGMYQYINTLPSQFATVQDCIDWHIKSGLVRDRSSAEISIPSLIRLNPVTNKYQWILDLRKTQSYWNDWFTSLSSQFIRAPFSKLLVLAGTDNLDKDLMIGQMQGKYQLVVFQDSGHFVQEDCSSRLAYTVMEFYQRTCGSAGNGSEVKIKTNWGMNKKSYQK